MLSSAFILTKIFTFIFPFHSEVLMQENNYLGSKKELIIAVKYSEDQLHFTALKMKVTVPKTSKC